MPSSLSVLHTVSSAGVSPSGVCANATGAIRNATAIHNIMVVNNFFIASPQWLLKAHGEPSVLTKNGQQQPGDLWVLRGVILGFSKEARTRDFPSPSFSGFGFVVVIS